MTSDEFLVACFRLLFEKTWQLLSLPSPFWHIPYSILVLVGPVVIFISIGIAKDVLGIANSTREAIKRSGKKIKGDE